MCRSTGPAVSAFPRAALAKPERPACEVSGEVSAAYDWVMRSPTDQHRVTGRTPVSVQWRGRPDTGANRTRRKELLAARLRRVLDDEPSLDVWWDTLSLSAQTVEALVDTAEFDRVVVELKSRGLRVDEVVDRQVV